MYNGVILDIHFPLVVYKQLLGRSPTLEDFEDFSPVLARGLKQLLQFDGDIEDAFCLNFEVGPTLSFF